MRLTKAFSSDLSNPCPMSKDRDSKLQFCNFANNQLFKMMYREIVKRRYMYMYIVFVQAIKTFMVRELSSS